MQTTGNLGLKKPDGTDIVDIADLNGNMDILDTAVQNVQDHAADTVKHITAAERTAWNAKASAAAATTSAAGLMAAADKAKLDGVAAGANKYVHPNHTGDVTSTGDGVTAIAPGVIVDADVNSAAAIGWSKISKTGASLADLPTRSAGDLSSGTLSAARLPAISGDITMAAGTGTAAITAGAIVNADINTAAAIDASKIGTGAVSNAEFGYLDGVTGGIQGQLNARPLLTTTPQQTTADITFYVRTDGNDSNTGLANTTAGAFKTIQAAIWAVPQTINHQVVINVAGGTYPEKVTVAGFSGSNNITIQGASTATATHMVNGFDVFYNSIHVNIFGFTGTRTDAAPFNAVATQEVFFYRCLVTASSASYAFNADEGAMMYLGQCVISNRGVAVYAQVEAKIFTSDLSGSANIVGYRAYYGGKITVTGTLVSSTYGYESQHGGQVLTAVGVISPWGDNTFGQRPAARAYSSASVFQSLAAATWTKMQFPQKSLDNLGNYDSSLHRFTVPQDGIYQINTEVVFLNPAGGAVCELYLYVNGGGYRRLGYSPSIPGTSVCVNGSASVLLYKGNIVEIYVACGSACNLSAGTDNNFEIVKVA